jgi:hypothetical protein
LNPLFCCFLGTLEHESHHTQRKMTAFYDPKQIYDPSTMPLVEGWEENNNCTFVRFHWVCTEAEQKQVDAHWRPLFYRHSLINTKMALATSAGAGIPGWDPFLGVNKDALNREKYWALADESLSTKIARGEPIFPTGLAEDPRVWREEVKEVCSEYSCDCSAHRASRGEPPRNYIADLLRYAAARAEKEIAEIHAQMLADWRARKSGSWAQRAAAAKEPEPTLADAARRRAERFGAAPRGWTRPGVWRPWEIEEILREETRQARVEAAWERADAAYKAINPTWGGGT